MENKARLRFGFNIQGQLRRFRKLRALFNFEGPVPRPSRIAGNEEGNFHEEIAKREGTAKRTKERRTEQAFQLEMRSGRDRTESGVFKKSVEKTKVERLSQSPEYGGIAQLGERLLCKQEVNGSIPFISTTDRV